MSGTENVTPNRETVQHQGKGGKHNKVVEEVRWTSEVPTEVEKILQGQDTTGQSTYGTGFRSGSNQGSEFTSSGESMGERSQQGTQYMADKAQQGSEYMGNKTKQGSEYVGEKAQHSGQYMGEKAQQSGQYMGEKAQQSGQYMGEKAQQMADTTQQGASYLSTKMQQGGEYLGEKMEQGQEATSQATQQTGGVINRIKDTSLEGLNTIKEYASQMWGQTKEGETTGPYAQKAEDKFFAAKESIPKSSEEMQSKTSEMASQAREQKNQVFEVLGQKYASYKQKLLEGLEEGGIFLRSTIDDGAGTLKHILSGPNALKVVENQQKFADELQKQDSFLVNVPKKSEHYEIRHVPQGGALCWEFIVESRDIDFTVKQRVKNEQNQLVHYTIVDRQRYEAGEAIQGKWEADEDSTVILEWDNSYSMMLSKNLACRIAIV